MPRPEPAAIHEAGHAVCAAALNVPFTAIRACVGGYFLDRVQWSSQPTASDLLHMAVVACAGPAAEWLFTRHAHRNASGLASASDEMVVIQCEALNAEHYPDHEWPTDLYTEGGHLFTRPGMEAAVFAVAAMLNAVGHVPADIVHAVVTECGCRPATITPVLRRQPVSTIVTAAPQPIDHTAFVGAGI